MDKLLGRARDRLSRRLSSVSERTKGDADGKRRLAASNPYGYGQASKSDGPEENMPLRCPAAGSHDAPPPYAAAAPPAPEYTLDNMQKHQEDPYYFLYLFDTVFLIDDSTSMLGERWGEVKAALRQMAPVCTSHDDDGIDVHFMNHKSPPGGPRAEGKAPGGYYDVADADAVERLFGVVRPCGPTPTRRRLEDVLGPYFALLRAAADVRDVKPLNVIVLTDGMPGPAWADGSNPHMPEPAIVHFARELDRIGAPLYQVGIQFIQVGDNAGATAMLDALDDGLPRRYQCRDIVDTLRFGQRGYTTLSAHQILKAVLGGVDKRLDNQTCH
ncbi:Uncharacterized protein TCAP_03110 [Tolypocladium capitatum]|uniref:VWFA domain-containing protein n=1 Tax=Tolypocladium capitatum TaxID=45235 RepID=A0A2K3QHG2_9HYPO|nr:Uncharacterized protein TCAP_03110 [Tolypocladium capitatum]